MNILLYIAVIWVLIDLVYIMFKDKFEKMGIRLYYGIVLVAKKPFSPQARVFFRKISYIWIGLFVIALYFFYSTMVSNIMVKYVLGSTTGTVQVLVPGVNITGVDLLYFALAVLTAALIHELAHAYTARSYGLKTKNIGFAILFFLPVAFVEIDEEELSQTSLKARIATLSAGPAVNFVLALLFMVILPFLVNPYGLLIVDVVPDSLAAHYGLEPGDILLFINETPITVQKLHEYLSINRTTTIILQYYDSGMGRVRNISIIKPGNQTLLGVYLVPAPSMNLVRLLGIKPATAILKASTWIYIVNMSLAVLNAAPLFISDGGRIIYEISKKKEIGHIVNTISTIIIILAILPL